MKSVHFNIVRWNEKFITIEIVLIYEKRYIIESVIKFQYTTTVLI